MKIHRKGDQEPVTKKLRSQTSHEYERRLSFYTVPPMGNISLEEFERFAIDRLKVLKELETLKIRGLPYDQFNNRMVIVLNKYLPLPRNNEKDDLQECIRKDVISHYILRLAYCQKEEDREWFLKHERELLKFRLTSVSEEDYVERFMTENGLHFKKLDKTEYEPLKLVLENTNRSMDIISSTDNHNNYVKVSFEECLDLVSRRHVFLEDGYAYVHKSKFINLLLARFRRHLDQELQKTLNQAPIWREDKRIVLLTESLPRQYLGREYTPIDRKHEIQLSDLDALAEQSMPLCMNHLHQTLRRDHHLKHMGRLQYGLFLKGIGISLEKSLEFWRSEFEKVVKDYEKQYAYNIRHHYGMVGKRTSYNPYGCHKIINMDVASEENHGCPFRHFDKPNLKKMLRQKNLSAEDINQVITLVEGHQFNEACKLVFTSTHPGLDIQEIYHPNQYFDKSETYFKEKAELAKVKPVEKKVLPTTDVIVS